MKAKNVSLFPVHIKGIIIMPGEIKEIEGPIGEGGPLEIIQEEEIEPKNDFIKLKALKGIGDELAQILLERFGNLENIKKASVENLMLIPGIDKKRATSILNQLKEAEV